MTALKAKPAPASRKRGRPRKDELRGERLRASVVEAAKTVYAATGYQRCSVELILKAANISRPTFYKLFADRHAVIDEIVREANNVLRQKVAAAIIGQADAAAMLRAGIQAYFDWCRDIGPLVGPIYSEINDPESPASTHRAQIIADFVALFHTQARILNEPELDPLLYDALLRAVEHAGSTAFWPRKLSEAQIQRRQAIALRIMLAAVLGPEHQEQVPALDSVVQPPESETT